VVKFCWSVFKWGLLVGLAAAVVAVPLLYQRLDEEIRRRVEEHFARHYPDLKVTVRSAELVEGEGIRVRGVSILDPSLAGPRAELLLLGEAFLACRADLNALVSGELDVSRVTLRQAVLRATRQPDGSWNAEKLLRLPPLGSPAPSVWIEGGTIEIFEPSKKRPAPLSLGIVSLHVTCCQGPREPGFGPATRAFHGTLGSEFVRNAQFEGRIDPETGTWTASGTIDELKLSPEMRHALPHELADRLPVLDVLGGLVTLRFRAGSGPTEQSSLRFELGGRLTAGRIDHAGLPRPVTDLEAAFRISNDDLLIENLSGASGPSTIEVKLFRLAGFEFGVPMWLDAKVRELELDQRLRDILPERLRPEWDKFLPAGKIDADVRLHYDGQRWKPDVTVDCLDAAFTYHKFPYRLHHVRGRIEWKNDEVTVDVVGDGGGRDVRVEGNITRPAPGCAFSFQVTASDAPLDEKLLAALKDEARRVVCSLSPRATLDCFFRCWRDEPGQPAHNYLHLAVRDAGACYEKFPYPLGNVSGIIERNDDHWEFRDFVGTNDTGRISCNGELDVAPEGKRWELHFSGTGVPLEEELRAALDQPHMQQLWNDLRLRGIVDFDATVRRLPGEKKATLAFLEARLDPQTSSIKPVWFPYEMENLEGTLVYRDGHVSSVGRVRAAHRRTKTWATVDCSFPADGTWRLRLGDLFVDRLDPDRELIAALPGPLRTAVEELKPGGPVHLRGTLGLAHGAGPAGPLTSDWDLEFTLHQGSIDCGIALENLNGGVRLRGDYDGRRFHAYGDLNLDSLTYNGVQFTQVMGPLEIKDDVVLLGASATPPSGEPARRITAELFGGTFCGSGWVAIRPRPEYQLHATLSDGDLSTFAQELMPGRQHLRGRMEAWVRLGGEGKSLNGLGGFGHIKLRGADIYELPLMMALLKILSVREPDTTAFSTSDIDFQIRGGHVYLTDIHFDGDAFSLEGYGVMDFDTSIQLTFRANMGRQSRQFELLREVFGRVSEEIMQIHVGGTMQNPIHYREPFPGVNEALRQLQAEMQRTTGAPPLFSQPGPFRQPGGRALNGSRRLPRPLR
jgi:hypothetical protein